MAPRITVNAWPPSLRNVIPAVVVSAFVALFGAGSAQAGDGGSISVTSGPGGAGGGTHGQGGAAQGSIVSASSAVSEHVDCTLVYVTSAWSGSWRVPV